jgi:hypothetical protein
MEVLYHTHTLIEYHKLSTLKNDISDPHTSVLSRTEKGHGIFFFLKGTLHIEFTKKGT